MVPPSAETKSPRSYLRLAVEEYEAVILRSIVSSSELQRSLFKMSTFLMVVTTSLAVQDIKLVGQSGINGNGTGLIVATALTGVATTAAITAIAASPTRPHPEPHLQACAFVCAHPTKVRHRCGGLPLRVQSTPFPADSTMSIYPSMQLRMISMGVMPSRVVSVQKKKDKLWSSSITFVSAPSRMTPFT